MFQWLYTFDSRYQKFEDERQRREQQFHLQQLALANERRREEREHELNIIRMLTSPGVNVPVSNVVSPSFLNAESPVTDQSVTYFQL